MNLGDSHLTYCMNVHPGETLGDMLQALSGPALAVKAAVSPASPFGVGLRIAAHAARELQDASQLADLRSMLSDSGMYAFTVNGFPYGAFHGQPVKQAVYRPDWAASERVVYTQQVARILSKLLPAGVDGTISTVPFGYNRPIVSEQQLATMANNVTAVVVSLWELEQTSGVRITLALEPEPDCVLQTSADVAEVFERCFYSTPALRALGVHCGVGTEVARELCARYLGVCVDTCHAAVEFESANEVFAMFQRRGVPVAKIQLSSGLQVIDCDEHKRDALKRFDEPVYLHQVVVRRRDGRLLRYPDLGDALRDEPSLDSEWRVHFHVPLHVAEYPGLGSTRSFVEDVLALHKRQPVTQHLEVETYTWDVLPERPTTIVESIGQELTWVLAQV